MKEGWEGGAWGEGGGGRLVVTPLAYWMLFLFYLMLLY